MTRFLKPAIAALLLTASLSAPASVVLSPGDIFIVGYTSNPSTTGSDGFSFVTWKDLDAGTTIGFTDGSYLGFNGAFGSWNGSEGFAVWRATSAVAAGTVIHASALGNTTSRFTSNSGFGGVDTGISVGGAISGLSRSGDQLFVYQPADQTATSYALPFSNTFSQGGAELLPGNSLIFGIDVANAGFVFSTADPDNQSLVPDAFSGGGALSLGVNAISHAYNNAVYDNAHFDPLKRDQSLMTPEEYKALIHNPANWVAVSGGSLNDTNFFVTPEPTSAVCLALGIGWLGLKRRRSSV